MADNNNQKYKAVNIISRSMREAVQEAAYTFKSDGEPNNRDVYSLLLLLAHKMTYLEYKLDIVWDSMQNKEE